MFSNGGRYASGSHGSGATATPAMRRTGPSAQTSATATQSGAMRRARCDHVSRASSRQSSEQRKPEVRAVLREVPAEAVRDRVQEVAADEREPGRDHEVREIGREDERRVDASRLEPGERGDQQRRDEQRREQPPRLRAAVRSRRSAGSNVGPRQKRATPSARAPATTVVSVSSVENESSSAIEQPARQHEAPIADLAAHVAQDLQREQRDREHQRHVQVTERLSEQVAREAEDPAAGQRWPEAAAELACEQVRTEGREGRAGDDRDVVGRDRAVRGR